MTEISTHRKVAIYKQDGTRHGGFGRATSLDDMSEELRRLGVNPRFPQKRLLPGQNNKMGGVRTGCCNVFEICETEFQAQAVYIEQAGYRLWPEKDDPVSHLYEDLNDDQIEQAWTSVPSGFDDASASVSVQPDTDGQDYRSQTRAVCLSDLYGKRINIIRRSGQ
jgi:hypothetical protein